MTADAPEYNPEAGWEARAQPATLAAALAELQTKLPHIAKDSKADIPNRPAHKYANLGSLSHELLPIMGELGLSFSCKPTVRKDQFGLRYKLRLAGTDEAEKGFWPLPGGAPQATGSALTYYRRYILQCLTGAVADDDDDGAQAGKVNRQRTSAKVAGAGHEKLRQGTVEAAPGDRPATRVKAGQNGGPDPWQDQPPGHFEETPPEERTGSIDGRQRSILMAHLGKLRRDERLGKLAGMAGREVESTNDLSWVEADRAIKAIEAEQNAAEQDAAAEATP